MKKYHQYVLCLAFMVTLVISINADCFAKRQSKAFALQFMLDVSDDSRYRDTNYILLLKHDGPLKKSDINFWNKEIKKTFGAAQAKIVVQADDFNQDHVTWTYKYARYEEQFQSPPIESSIGGVNWGADLEATWVSLKDYVSRWLDEGLWLSEGIISLIEILVWVVIVMVPILLVRFVIKQIGKLKGSLTNTKPKLKAKTKQPQSTSNQQESRNNEDQETGEELPTLEKLASQIVNLKDSEEVLDCPLCASHGIFGRNLQHHLLKRCKEMTEENKDELKHEVKICASRKNAGL